MRLTSALVMAILTATSAVLASMSTFKYATDDDGKRHYLSCKDKLPKASMEGDPWKWKTDCRQIEFNDVPVGALVEEYGKTEDTHKTSFTKPNPKCPLSPLPQCPGDDAVDSHGKVMPRNGLWAEGPFEPFSTYASCFYHGEIDGVRIKNCTGSNAAKQSVWTRLLPVKDEDAKYFQDGFLMEELVSQRTAANVPASTVTDVPIPHNMNPSDPLETSKASWDIPDWTNADEGDYAHTHGPAPPPMRSGT